MRTRTLPTLVVVAALAAVAAACGDDTTEPGAAPSTLPDVPATDVPPTSDQPPATSAPPATDGGYEHPSDPDEIVFEYAELGGFTTPEFMFQSLPNFLVSGDGRVFQPGAQIAIYPGPLVPAVEVRSVTETGIQQLLAAADAAGLFATVDYTFDSNIADATTATVTISANGETWVHEAYALGISGPGDGEPSPEREALATFLAELQRGAVIDEAELGEGSILAPEQYFVRANPVDDPSALTSDDFEPRIVEWPAAASVRLSAAEQCAAVSADEVGALLAEADQLTFFTDDGNTYQVFVRPGLPGMSCDR